MLRYTMILRYSHQSEFPPDSVRLFKHLFTHSPSHCAWLGTGSSMAAFWANIAVTPVNGFSLLNHCRRLYLPISVDTDTMATAWQQLDQRYSRQGFSLPKELAALSPPHHALLSFFCSEWAGASLVLAAIGQLAPEIFQQKMVPEVGGQPLSYLGWAVGSGSGRMPVCMKEVTHSSPCQFEISDPCRRCLRTSALWSTLWTRRKGS